MEVEAIGRAPQQQGALNTSSAVNQEEFVRLFIAQLQAQDPAKPMDNSEFLAQLAQFSNVQQNLENGRQLESLNFINSVNQSTGLLGKTVEIATSAENIIGEVTTVRFTNDGPRLTVTPSSGTPLDDVRLSQIRLVRE
jgi:flagellar basal-body rod modification protein FlgD